MNTQALSSQVPLTAKDRLKTDSLSRDVSGRGSYPYNSPGSETIVCEYCGFSRSRKAKFCEGCAETYQVNQRFRREGIRFLSVTLTFICWH